MSSAARKTALADGLARERAIGDLSTNLIVTAGAGTGKTSLLVERMLNVVVGEEIPLDRIVAMTFTDKAAAEMRMRLAEALEQLSLMRGPVTGHSDRRESEAIRAYRRLRTRRGLDEEAIRSRARRAASALDRSRVGTIHAFCADLLRQHPQAAGVDPYFEVDQGPALNRQLRDSWDDFLAAELGTEAPRPDLWRAALKLLSMEDIRALSVALCDFKIPLELVEQRAPAPGDGADAPALALAIALPFAREFRRSYLHAGHVSFDALLVLTRNLLRDHPAVRERVRGSIDQLLVDEFQDTDPLQYEIVFFLAEQTGGRAIDAYAARPAPGRLFIVGDPKQSIYRFRGADMSAYGRAVSALSDAGGAPLSLTSSFRAPDRLLAPLNVMFGRIIGPGDGASSGYEPVYEPIQSALNGADSASGGIEIWSVETDGAKAPGASQRRLAEGRAIARWIHEETCAGRLACRNVALLFRKLTDVDYYLRALGEWDVPFVLQGGSAFHERPEVAELVSLLRAAVNPNDHAALLGVLRSPLGGCSDEDLARLRAAGHPLRLDALERIDERDFPCAWRALRMITDLRRRLLDLPIDEGLRAILDETPLLELNASAYQGARRVANLRKLMDRLAETALRESLSLEAALALLDEEFRVERRSGDSPLADETVEAVRILTIHSAKGLEFPVVLIPDLAREDRRIPSKDIIRWVDARGGDSQPGTLAMSLAEHENEAWTESEEKEERHREAEEKRVFYVACTRARERLILVNGHPKPRSNSLWIRHVGALNYQVGGAFPPPGDLAAGVRHLLLKAPGRRTPSETPIDVAPARDATLLFESAVAAARAAAKGGIKGPSGIKESLEEALEAKGEAGLPQRFRGGEGASGRAVGRAIHAALATWDFSDKASLFLRLSTAATEAAGEQGLETKPVLDRATALLDRFLASELPSRFQRVEILGREIPMLMEDEGETWWGWIDLVLREDGDVVVVDWKTDADDDFAVSGPARHGEQLRIYARAVKRALGLAASPRCELVHIPTARAILLQA